MDYYSSIWAPTDSLMHYGVIGMKWGVRRYQNKDGSLTAEGKKHAQKIRKAFEYDRYNPKKESWREYYEKPGGGRDAVNAKRELANEYVDSSGFLKEANDITEKLRVVDLGKAIDEWTDQDTKKINDAYHKLMNSLDPLIKEAKLSDIDAEDYKVFIDDAFWDHIYGFGY